MASLSKIKYLLNQNLNHIVSICIIFIMASLLFYKSYFENGMLIYVDMTWPLSISRTMDFYNYTWFPYGSFANFENINRIFWTYPLLFICNILNQSIESYLKILFLVTFFLAGCTIYSLTYYLLSTNIYSNEKLLSFSSIISALIYMYNPWSLGHLWTYFMYPTYALLPLILLLTIKYFYSNNKSVFIILCLLMTIASTTPHGIIWIWFAITLYTIFNFIISNEASIRDKLKTHLFFLLPLLVLYILLNIYWLFPYLMGQIYTDIAPTYTFTPQTLEFFSTNSNTLNVMRLGGSWGLPVESTFDNNAWIISSLFLAFISFFSLIVIKNNRNLLFFGILATISLYLAMGSNAPFGFYEWLAFDSPLKHIGWCFKAPDRWLNLTAISYSIMAAFSIVSISSASKSFKMSVIIISIIIISIIYPFYPVAHDYSEKVFNPTPIPNDYSQLNAWLNQQEDTFKVVWFPVYKPSGYHPSWAPEKRVGGINIWSSSAESINNFNMVFNEESIFYRMEYAINNNDGSFPVIQLISHLSAKYIIIDTSLPHSDIINAYFKSNDFVKPVYNTSILKVYENPNYIPEISIPKIIERADYYDPVLSQLSIYEYKNIAIIEDNNSMSNINTNLFNGELQTVNITNLRTRINKNEKSATIIEYEKLNPTLFKIKVDAQKPFMLKFAESYDPLWVVHVDKINETKVSRENIHPIPVYSTINGFWITDTGMLEITIEYLPQKWFYYGLFISGFVFIGCVGFLLWNKRKSKIRGTNDK